MRRLDGVIAVRLDTVDQYAEVWVDEPRELDFGDFEQAAEDALYTTSAIYVQARGHLTSGQCEDCGRERDQFQIEGSNQRFELGKHALERGRTYLLDAAVISWDEDCPQLVPTN